MEAPSITLTTRNDLSLLYKCLRTVIRPLRPRLVKPGKPLPAGSPKLKRPNSKSEIQERISKDIYLYDFHPPGNGPATKSEREVKHQIFYFAGGGFQSPPSSEHWKLCSDLCFRLRDTHQITLVSYPLAPNSPAAESLPLLHKWLETELSIATSKSQRVTLIGDSAGGNIVLSLTFWWATKLQQQQQQQQQQKQQHSHSPSAPSSPLINALAVSPATDLTNTNPSIATVDKYDPVLSIALTTSVAHTYAGALPLSTPSLSPNLSDFTVLAMSNINIHGVVGTHDVLAPDAIVFRELCEKNGVRGEWLEWEGQMHCFPLASVYGLREGREGRDWVVDVLRRNV